jgi:hypothetical protein
MAAVMALEDMAFGDYGLGGPLLGAETVGFDLANPLLGGPEQGGSYTGGVGGGLSRTEAERLAAILNVNPYVAPSADMNLDPITSLRSGGQTGYYFANELGLPARFGEVGLPQPADPATFDPNAQYAATAPGFVPVDPNATYRLVEGGTNGDVVYAGEGGEGLRNVFEQANKLTLDDPKNAYWGVEVLDPATGQFERVAENQGPNGLGIVGDIAGVALPVAAAIATGGASLGVQIAAGAAAGGLGGFLAGNDPLESALISGVTAGLGNVTGFNEAVGGVLSNAGDAVKNALVPELAKQAATEASGDIVVNALSNLAQGTASGLLQGAASGVTGNLSPPSTQPTPTQQPVQEPVQEPVQPPVDNTIVVSATPPVSGSGLPFGAAAPVPVEAILSGLLPAAQPTPTEQPTVAQPEEIVVTAPQTVTPPIDISFSAVLPTLPGLQPLLPDPALMQPVEERPVVEEPNREIVVTAPKVVTPVPDIPFSAILPTLPALTELAMDPTLTQPEPEPEEIVVTGNKTVPKTVVPDELAAILPLLPALGIPQVPTPDPALTEKDGILGTGLNAPQLVSIGGIIADLLKNLSAGGDTGPTTPYVSPFGTGTGLGLGTGRDMRANPNIIDYERYGFGPEAMFFQPGYGLLNSATPAPAPAFIPQAQPIMATNPRYEPLI